MSALSNILGAGNVGSKGSIFNSGINTTNGTVYFLRLDNGERLDIQFFPEKLSHTRNLGLQSIQIIGRNIPKYQYMHGEAELALTLDFYADEESRTSVISKCRWLEACAINNKYKKSPPKVALVFGDLYRKDTWVVKSLKYDLSNFNKVFNNMPQQAIVDITLSLDMDSNIGWDDVQTNYSRGMQDGANPVNLGFPRNDDDLDNDPSKSVKNDNSFKYLLNRALNRLRLGPIPNTLNLDNG